MSYVHLRPRLAAAASLLKGDTLADVGCDHGRLCAFLLQSGSIRHAIGIDCSAPSLEKAAALRALCGLENRWELRVGDGLSVLHPGEADILSFCGMGGELISSLIDAQSGISRSASMLVMQPMGGMQELRAYLYSRDYEIVDEMLVKDSGRIYQIIAARSGTPRPLPDGYPSGFFTFGALSLQKRDPLLIPALQSYLSSHQRRLTKALAKGSDPDSLRRIIWQTETLIELAKGYENDEA